MLIETIKYEFNYLFLFIFSASVPTLSNLRFNNVGNTFVHAEWDMNDVGSEFEEISHYIISYNNRNELVEEKTNGT